MFDFEESWAVSGDGGGAGGYTPSGSAYFDDLPTPSKDYLGYVYNMLEDFTTTNDFLEGAGKTYSAGSNVVIVDAGSVDNPRYMYDVLSGFIDLSGYEPLIFFGTMAEWEALSDAEKAKYKTLKIPDTRIEDIESLIPSTATSSNKLATASDVSAKQSQITQSSLLTLTVAGWDSTTLQQTVSFTHDITKRNVIDITIGEMTTWSECGVRAVSETATGITFECDTVPETALTFTVTSMEVS